MVYHGLGGKTVVHAAVLDFLSQEAFKDWEVYNLSTEANTAQHPLSELYELTNFPRTKRQSWGRHPKPPRDLITETDGTITAGSKAEETCKPQVEKAKRTQKTLGEGKGRRIKHKDGEKCGRKRLLNSIPISMIMRQKIRYKNM